MLSWAFILRSAMITSLLFAALLLVLVVAIPSASRRLASSPVFLAVVVIVTAALPLLNRRRRINNLRVFVVRKPHHHQLELFEVDLTIPIDVDFAHYFFPNGSILADIVAEDLGDLSTIDGAAAVFVKQFEGRSHVWLVQKLLLLYCGRAPLVEVDLTAAIHVSHKENSEGALVNHLRVLVRVKAPVAANELVPLNKTITVLVKLKESRLELRQLLLCGQMRRHKCQRSLLQLRVVFELSEVAKCVLHESLVGRPPLHLLGDPGIGKGILRCDAFDRVSIQQLFQETFCFFADVLPLFFSELPGTVKVLHFFQDLFVTTTKGRHSAEQNVENDSDTPHVALLVVIAEEHFWRDVVRRAVELSHLVVSFLIVMRCAEVDYLERDIVRFELNQNILRLQVTVRDLVRVAVCHRHQDFLDDRSCLLFVKLLEVQNCLEQLLPVAKFSYQVDLVLAHVDFVQPQNVWVVEVLENINFVHQTHALLTTHAKLVDYFDSTKLIVRPESRLFDLAKGTCSDGSAWGHLVFLLKQLHILVLHYEVPVRSLNVIHASQVVFLAHRDESLPEARRQRVN
uniref:Uncharacterized protein n=1 Tax=Favella ehrenbergii TaxID=182087 RepID=A0A7S3HXY7_9SPIT|mmetsp:Transcript_16498/g.20891  ORF Transcript_16498/g.20891 Transcript_16498/m.20891 type:complete len:569 (+) Transcript_16498:293-1999(+)